MKTVTKSVFAFICLILTVGFLGCNGPAEVPSPPEEESKTITLHLITERISGRHNEPLSYRTRATYDERGLATAIVHEDFAIPSQSYHYVYKYNEYGHLLYKAKMENGKETATHTPYEYTYTPEGVLTSVRYDESSYAEYEYDAQGRVIKKSIYADGVLRGYDECTYNTDGLLDTVSFVFLKQEQSPGYSSGYKYVYDDQGRLIGMEGPNDCIREYDEYGNLIRENDYYYTYSGLDGVITNMQNTKSPDTHYVYDELGRLVRMEDAVGYTQWTYQTIEVPVENQNMAIWFYGPVNERPGMQCYYNKFFNYLLLKPDIID